MSFLLGYGSAITDATCFNCKYIALIYWRGGSFFPDVEWCVLSAWYVLRRRKIVTARDVAGSFISGGTVLERSSFSGIVVNGNWITDS